MKYVYRFSTLPLLLSLLLNFTPSLNAQSNPSTSAPASGSDRPFRFAVLSDSRSNDKGDSDGVHQEILQPLLNQALADSAAFVFFPGDLVYGPHTKAAVLQRQFESWKRFVQPVETHIPIYTGMGNHDQMRRWIRSGTLGDYVPVKGKNSGEAIFARCFVNPVNGPDSSATGMPTYRENVYSFDWGSGHFVMLNSNYFQKGGGRLAAHKPGDVQGTLRNEQLDWLEEDLEQARSRGQKHLFVAAHEPAFPNSEHAKDAMWWDGKRLEMIEQRDVFWKILCKYKVVAAFFGHEHNYNRSLIDASVNPEYDYPVWQIITGGAGAPLYGQNKSVPWAGAVKAFYSSYHFCLLEIEGDQIWLEVLTPEGKALERVNLTER